MRENVFAYTPQQNGVNPVPYLSLNKLMNTGMYEMTVRSLGTKTGHFGAAACIEFNREKLKEMHVAIGKYLDENK